MHHLRLRHTLLAALIAAWLVLFAAPSSVAAHAALEASSPAANSILEQAPDLLTLDFDEPITARLASIDVFDQTGAEVDVGAPIEVTDPSIVQADLPTLADGTYAVVWRVTSVDGHVVDGAFSFQIGTSASVNGQDLVDRVSAGSSADPGVGRSLGVVRWVGFVGLICVAGALLIGRWSEVARLRSLYTAGAVTVLIAAAAAYGLYGAQVVAGGLGDALRPSVWGDIATTRTGRWLLVRMICAAVLVLALSVRRRSGGQWRVLAAAAAVGAAASWSASGHPAATEPSAAWGLLDAVHYGAAAVWGGGLLAMLWAGRAWRAADESTAVLRRFSSVATVAVPVIVVTGVVQGLHLGDIDDVTATDWGRYLLVKVVLVAVLVTLGGVSRWLLQHDHPSSVGRLVAAEALLGVAVLGLTAGLVGVPPREVVTAAPVNVTLTNAGVVVDVTVTPGLVGRNELHMVVTPPGGSLDAVAGLTARVSLPAEDSPFSPVTVTNDGINHYTGSITFPTKGTWRLEIIVETAPAQTVLLTTDVTVAG
jgi:copper transport protein